MHPLRRLHRRCAANRRKRSLPIFPAYMWKVRPRARPGPSCRPSGQPGVQASWPAKRASLACRESATWRENLKRALTSCRGLQEKGSKQEIRRSDPNLSRTFTYFIYEPRLLHSIKGQSNETFIQFNVLGSSDLISQPHYLWYFLFFQDFGVVLIHLLYFLFLPILAWSLSVYELIDTLFIDL